MKNMNNFPPSRQPATLSIDDAAFYLGLSSRTIQRQVSAGSMKSIKIGRRRLILRTEIDRLLGGTTWRNGGAA